MSAEKGLETIEARKPVIALALMALFGALLIFLFPGCPEQDTDFHFLEARTSWSSPWLFVDVWGRPLYTTVYALPALLGFTAARFFAVGIGVAVAWQTWRLACDLRLQRAWLVIPLLLGQPVFFELFPDLLTEPLFALVFVVALRWHLRGRARRGMLAASLLPLARPEGVFLCLLWAVWVMAKNVNLDRSTRVSIPQQLIRNAPPTLLLATGVFCWLIAALCLTHDPLFILHNWPSTWHRGVYGHGTLFSYGQRASEFLGVLLALPFAIGLWCQIRVRSWVPVITSVLLLFFLHTLFRAYGLFGEAGYPRYMVSVAPAIALLTLQGWNTIASKIAGWSPFAYGALGSAVLSVSLLLSFWYLDSFPSARDPIAIREMFDWLHEHPVPYRRLVWSNAQMCIVCGLTLKQSPSLQVSRRETILAWLRDAPPSTLVFWDDHFGPDWFGLTAADIEDSGFNRLRTRRYSLPGVVVRDVAGNRELELSLLLKP
ncbi:MAG: hypothetical protein JO334_11955 [Verrucomicrobia bacterium]|nr:hypothetical protein [Verrucomicrobiota bacterium]